MKILFISSSIPPVMDMQTIRNIQLLEYFIKNKIKFDIICTKKCTNVSLNQNSNIYYISTDLLFNRVSTFLIEKIKINFLTKVFNVLSKFFFIPDNFMGWPELFEKENINNIDLTGYTHIYSSSGSFFAHVIASKLKAKYEEIKWIADYGDPWGINKYGTINKSKSTLEINTISNCDKIFVTTRNTEKYYSKYLISKNINIPLVFFPCGFTKKKYDSINYDISKFIKISYAGVAFKKDRDLTKILKVVNENSRYIMEVCGTYSSSYVKYSVGNNRVIFKGKLGYENAQRILENSNVLLHIGNKGYLQIPGKTYILLSIPKPIIYIRQEKQHDPTFELLNNMKGVVFCFNNIKSIKKALTFVSLNYENLLQDSIRRQSDKEFTKYEWTNIFNNIIGEFNE